MSIESRSAKYAKALGQWQAGQMLGTGSGGKSAVFAISRDNGDWQERSAMKIITLLEEWGSYEALPAHRQAEYSAAEQQVCHQATREVRLMEQLRGKTNIVDYLEHRFMRWQDAHGFGIDLVIQMEQLTDLRSQLRQGREYSPEEIRHVAEDLCRALMICHGKKILHRDIKPENIFFNQDDDYKLGDFGIARIMNDSPSQRASTGVGTVPYIAPEQTSGHYDERVDIYSLGLVLYELANGNRLPFAASAYITEADIQTRLAGTPLPPPRDTAAADPELTRIILKACAFRPDDRFSSAREMLHALTGRSDSIPPVRSSTPTPAPSDPYSTAPATLTPAAASPVVIKSTPTVSAVTSPAFLRPAAPPVPPQEQVLTGELIVPKRTSGKKFPFGLLLLPLAALLAVAALFLLAHRHSWEAATCTEPETCAECGETRGEPLGHDWLEANCTDSNICSRCGIRSGSPLGHRWTGATCQEPETCAECGETRGEALGHDWLEATATEPQRCSRCGQTLGRALGLPVTQCRILETTNGGSRKEDILSGTWTDAFGNTYEEALRFWVAQLGTYTDTEHIVYALDGAYTQLELTAAPVQDSADNTSTKIYIYADGVPLYESVWISTASGAVTAALDVTGVRQLKIQCVTDSPAHCYCVVDAVLFV